jgi:uncharacterized membrane protein YccC
LFVAFSLDLKTPAWAMLTVYLTSQPLSGALRAKAVYRVIGTSSLSGVAAMIETAPLEKAPEAYAKMMSGKARFRMVLVTGQ